MAFNILILLLFLSSYNPFVCGQQQETNIDVPNIFEATDQNKWLVIKSKQITKLLQTHPKESSWLVEDHYHFSRGISYSLYTNERNKKETYSSISHHGKIYYATSNDGDWLSNNVDCRLDHRQDHRTLFPWKYTKLTRIDNNNNNDDKLQGETNKLEPFETILGFGAVWLNLIENKVNCSILGQQPSQLLNCKFDDQKQFIRLSFRWPIEKFNGLVMPKSAQLYRSPTVHLDGYKVIRHVTIDVLDISVTNFESLKSEEGIRNVLDTCKGSLNKKEVQFPSLIKSIDKSYRQTYHLSYSIKLYNLDEEKIYPLINSNKPLVISQEFSYEEWFSNQREEQTIVRKDKKEEVGNEIEKFYSLFKYRMPRGKKNLIYKTKFYFKQPPSNCELVENESDFLKLFSISHLFTRRIHFEFAKDNKDPDKKRNIHHHSGYLIGLGALLMNVADIQNKKLVPTISKTTNEPIINSKWHSRLEWIVEDVKSAHKFHFFFRSHSMEEHQLEVDDLIKVEVRQLAERNHPQDNSQNGDKLDENEIESADNGLSEDEELEKGDYLDLIVMSIDLLDFSTSLYQDQINFAFNLPEICNFSEKNLEENTEDTEVDGEKENDSNETKKTDDDEEVSYEFPNYEQFLQLARDYVIHSEWNFDDGTFIKVIEYLMINVNDQNEDELLTRLDVTRAVNELDIMEEYSIYLRYSENIMLRYERDKCNYVSQLDDWLEVLASNKVYGDHCKTLEDYFDGKPPLKFYSLGALWKIASESSYIQFLGKFSGLNDPDQSNEKLKLDYGLWLLEEDKNIPHLSAMFKFYFLNLNQVDVNKRLKLASIQIDTSHRLDVTAFKTVNSIKIENIFIETNTATMLYFMLPSSCDSIIDRVERERARKEAEFPSFKKYLNTLSDTSKDYEFRYNLIMSFKGDTSSYSIAVVESSELISLFIGEQKWRIWSRIENKTLIEQVSSGLCKPSKDLLSLFELQDFIDVISSNFEHIKQQQSFSTRSLLANLWNLIGLRVEQEQKSSIETGARLKVIAHAKYEHQHLNSHQKLVEWSISDTSRQISISITFKHLSPKENESTLYSLILLSPNYTLRFMNQYNPRRSNINYVSLPEACFQLVSIDRFPKISSQLEDKTNGAIYLRSEIISTSPFEGGNMMLILDEWLKPSDRSYRSQSRSLKTTSQLRDFLIYTETEESFDLSTNFKCFTKDPNPNNDLKRPVNIQPVKNFILRELLSMVGNNGGAFYHPLALWFFAEQSEVRRTLIEEKNEQLNFKDFFTDLLKINNWLYNEQWHIEHNEYRTLSYTLKFNTKFESQKQKFLMVLSNLDTMDWRQDISVEVVNYKYMHHDTDIIEQFLIPKGRGCKRNDKAKEKHLAGQVDVLVLERLNPIQFDYSASLETLEDNQEDNSIQLLSPRPMFYSGWFGKCPPSWTLEPVCALKVHHERRHYLNGTVKSQRQVISGEHVDPFIVQVRSLDENSGYCSVRVEKKPINNHLLNLDFNIDGFKEMDLIQVNDLPFFDLINLKPPEYELIQLRQIEGEEGLKSDGVKLVYELRLSNFSLNPQLSGETSLIRTLERRATLKPVGNYFYHSNAKLEVIIENKAKFTINIENLGYKECLSTLSRSKIEECYQSSEFYQSDPPNMYDTIEFYPRLRKFHLIYYSIDNNLNGNIDGPPREYKEMSESIFEKMKLDIERSFADSFLRLAVDFSATQLGKAQVNFRNEDKTIHIIFNMMEPPSALEYFAEFKKKKMRPSSTLLSPIKVLNSKHSCSKWCDIEHCSAFSYCTDRSCQILILDIDDTSYLIKNDPAELSQKINLLDDDSCSYYKAPIYQPKATLNSVINFMRNTMLPIELQNNTKHSKDQLKFILSIPNSKAQIEFIAKELVEVIDDDIETTKEKAQTSETKLLETYSILKEQFQISGFKLENQPKDKQILVKYHLIQANNLAKCFSECSIINCQLLSYCNKARICSLLTNISSSQDFRSILNGNSEQNDDCSIYGRDFLVKYQRFADTRKPRTWKSSISDISLLECASICEFETSVKSIKQLDEASNFDCLSFDYCSIPNSNSNERTYTCFIQDMHIIMDDFDDNIMINKPTKDNNYQVNQADCSHYSRSLSADFSKYSNKIFTSHNSIIFKGIDLEKCTLICRRDEVCLGFEYCGFDLSCFILRKQDNAQRSDQDFDAFNQLVDEASYKNCQVFKLKHIEEEIRIQFGAKDSVTYHHIERAVKLKAETWLEETFVLLSISLIALVFGAIFHISLVILTGKKLQLKPPFITDQ